METETPIDHEADWALKEAPPGDAAERLKAERVQLKLAKMSGWRLSADGRAIIRRFKFPALRPAITFTALVAELSAALLHQPGLSVHGNDVLVIFSTPAAGGLTELDFASARAISLLPAEPAGAPTT